VPEPINQEDIFEEKKLRQL